MTVMFESDRPFQLWRAVVGHRQLLLRSTKSETERTRIDVLFKPVRAMKIRTLLDGLRVREAEPHEVAEIAREAAEEIEGELKVFVIESGSFTGYVVASAMTTAEDDGEYSDPSPLLVG
jgi:hypothetical protein